MNSLDKIFEKCSNIKFNENPSSGSRVLHGRTDVTKLTIALRNSANARKQLIGAVKEQSGILHPVQQKSSA
jgi:hypothetical protein